MGGPMTVRAGNRRLVVRLILKEVALLLVPGVIVGLVVAAAAARATASLLYGLQPGDPATLVSAAAILGAIGLIAGYLPARRAARLEPITVLREE